MAIVVCKGGAENERVELVMCGGVGYPCESYKCLRCTEGRCYVCN